MVITPLLGYPTRWGNKIVEFVDLVGPSYYFTGGVEFDASQLALGGIDAVISGLDETGAYRVEGRCTAAGATQSIDLIFTVVATGVQVTYGTDLSSKTFRIGFVGV